MQLIVASTNIGVMGEMGDGCSTAELHSPSEAWGQSLDHGHEARYDREGEEHGVARLTSYDRERCYDDWRCCPVLGPTAGTLHSKRRCCRSGGCGRGREAP